MQFSSQACALNHYTISFHYHFHQGPVGGQTRTGKIQLTLSIHVFYILILINCGLKIFEKRILENPKKQNFFYLNLLHAGNYLYSIYILLGI